MTIILQPTRALSQHLFSRSHQLLAKVTYSTHSILRVDQKHNALSSRSQVARDSAPGPISSISFRSYATNTPAKPLGRPKGHTGRAPAKRKPAAGKATPSSTAAKRTAPKKTVKKTASRKKAKPKPKPKPKKRPISITAQKRLATQKNHDLKEKALLKSPKKLPETAWTLLFAEAPKGTPVGGGFAKLASEKYKNLSAEERERYNHTANANKEKNAVTYKKWLSTFTPLQIKEANKARNQLKRQAKEAGKKKQFQHIQDDRLVKQAGNAYAFFFQERYSSGDMKGMKVDEVGGLVGREWKGLSAAEKKKFENMAAQERNRYHEEYKTVYGTDPPSVTKKAKKAA